MTNDATYSQDIGNITAAKGTVVDASDVEIAGCPASEFELVEVADNVAPLAAGATSDPVTVAKVRLVDNPAANQDPCQGAKLNLSFTSAQGS